MEGDFKYLLIILSFLSFYGDCHRIKRIVGGIQAAAPPPDDPVIFIKLYGRDARLEGNRNLQTGYYSFLGIRYAEPPVDELRFNRPKYRRLSGDVNATVFGPPCPQLDDKGNVIGQEDCLLLNIYTPHIPDENTELPVIVWIHGGGFRYGSAAQYNVYIKFKFLV